MINVAAPIENGEGNGVEGKFFIVELNGEQLAGLKTLNENRGVLWQETSSCNHAARYVRHDRFDDW